MKRKIAALEQQQFEMKLHMEQMSLLLQKQREYALSLPSPGRESGVLNCERKRSASANFVQEKEQKIMKSEGYMQRSQNTERTPDVFDPENLDSVIDSVERRLYEAHPPRNVENEKQLAHIRKHLLGIIDEGGSISSISFDDEGD